MNMHIAETTSTAANTAEVSVEATNPESSTLAAVDSPDQDGSRDNTLQALGNESPDLFTDPANNNSTEPAPATTVTTYNEPATATQESSQSNPERPDPVPETASTVAEVTQSPSLWDRAAGIYSSMKAAVVDVVAPPEGDTRTFTERLQSGFTSVAENCTDFVCDIFGVDDETRASWKQKVSGFVSGVFSFFKAETERQAKTFVNTGSVDFDFLAASPEEDKQTDTHHQQQQANGPDTPYIPSRLAGIYRTKNSWEEMAAADIITEAIAKNLDEDNQETLQEREQEVDFRINQVEAARVSLADTHDNSQVLEDYIASESDFSYRKSIDELITEVQNKEGSGTKT